MPTYIWERDRWPNFTWESDALLDRLALARRRQGELLGEMSGVGFADRRRATAQVLTENAVESSEIEGETLSRASVRSSVARRLGLEAGAAHPKDAKVDGVVAMTIDATNRLEAPLTADRLFAWHRDLFPVVLGASRTLTPGRWRDDKTGPMQVVSGRVDRLTIHFEAPPADRLEAEMKNFLYWFNLERRDDGILRSAIAHLWFVTIHPFDDGNGRIARAIGDMALAQDEGSSDRFYSISRQIRIDKVDYYDALERAQKGDIDITGWLAWFLDCYTRAVDNARTVLGDVLAAAHFWQEFAGVAMSERQRHVLRKVLDGFEGSLTTRKWAKIAQISPDTALREITDLIEKGVLEKNPGGSRTTSYKLASPRSAPQRP